MWQRFLDRGGLWVVGQFVLMGLVFAAGWWGGSDTGPTWARGLGLVCACLGAVFGLGGVAVLGPNRTAYPKPKEGSHLVQHGIYRWVRHPLYTSLMFLGLGWAAWRFSLEALVATLALIVLLHAKARREERWLMEQFPEYAAYRRRAKRFLPWIY